MKLEIITILLISSLMTKAQNGRYYIKARYNVSRALIEYAPYGLTKVSPVKIIEPLNSNAELLFGYSISEKLQLAATFGFQQYSLGYYEVKQNPINASAGVSGGSGEPIGYLKTFGFNITAPIINYRNFEFGAFLQPMLGQSKFSGSYLDTSSNEYFWADPNEYIWKIKYPAYTNGKINKLLRFGLDLSYTRNKKLNYSLGSSYQIGSNVFLIDSTSLEIHTQNIKEMYTAKMNGSALIFTLSFKYKFNFRRDDY